MTLDKELLGTILESMAERQFTAEESHLARDLCACPIIQAILVGLAIRDHNPDSFASLGTALQIGFEMGMEYAELSAKTIKK